MNEYSGFSQTISNDVIYKAQRGSHKAMELIYKTYANACFRLAMRILQDTSASEDVVHNSFVKAMNNIHRFEHKGPFAGWLRQIAVNEALTVVRRQGNTLQTTSFEESAHEEYESEDTYFDARWWEACIDLAELTKELPVQARTVLFLHELEGYSHKEIADLLGKTESFSKQTLSRALKRLKEMATKEGAEK